MGTVGLQDLFEEVVTSPFFRTFQLSKVATTQVLLCYVGM